MQGLRQSKGKHAQNREIKMLDERVRGWFGCRACDKVRGNTLRTGKSKCSMRERGGGFGAGPATK